MKTALKFAAVGLLFALFPALSLAQTTAVTATVKDPNGVPYAGATVRIQLTTPGATVTINNAAQCASAGLGSAPCQMPIQGTYGPFTLDSTGSFSTVLYSNTSISPSGTQYIFTVNISPGVLPPWGTGPQLFSTQITITGSSQNISSTLNALAPALTVSASFTPAGCGSNTQVTYNNAGTCAGAPGLTYTVGTGGTSIVSLTNPSDFWTFTDTVTGSPSSTLSLVYGGALGPESTFELSGFAMLSAPGINSLWGSIVASSGLITSSSNDGAVYSISAAANAVGSQTTYTGVFSGGNQPAKGQSIAIAGFTNAGNNGTFIIGSSTTGSVTVFNSGGVAESHAATGTLQNVYAPGGGSWKVIGAGTISSPPFAISGSDWPLIQNTQCFPFYVCIAIQAEGEDTDAGFLRIINDGSTGNHGLEIGAVIDGTGASPVLMDIGHFNGQSEFLFNSPISSPSFIAPSNGVDTSSISFAGNTTNPPIPPNTANIWGPNLTTFTGWGINLSTAAPGLEQDALGTTTTSAWTLYNATAASSGSQQYSPYSGWCSNGWDSGASASRAVCWRMYGLPVQSSGLANSAFSLESCVENSAATCLAGTGWTTGQFEFDQNGYLNLFGISATQANVTTVAAINYETQTNCIANGTAANPSVASCGANRAGLVSCSTSASTGTCVVDTTAVTADSEIFVTENSADGTPLSVTCNTTNVLNTTKPLIASKSAGTSFTINLGTVATNPACFEFFVVN